MAQIQAALTEVMAACGHMRKARLSLDPQRAMTEIEQLSSGQCAPCVQAERRQLGDASGSRIFWPGVR